MKEAITYLAFICTFLLSSCGERQEGLEEPPDTTCQEVHKPKQNSNTSIKGSRESKPVVGGELTRNVHLRPLKKREVIDALEKATSPKEIKNICTESEGVFFQIDSGRWIAIPYYCGHCYGYDLAIYYDSNGNWLESEYHFCHLGLRDSDVQSARNTFNNKLEVGVPRAEATKQLFEYYGGDSLPAAVAASKDLTDLVKILKTHSYFKELVKD